MDDITDEHWADITADDVIELSCSRAADAALVRYHDGTIEVRSLLPGGVDDALPLIKDEYGRRTPFAMVVEQDQLYDLTDDWDGEEMDEETAATVAEMLNAA